ncbi:beta-aspartyl-peptidase [Lagierella sp.]|uniref:beta-aspartyl-peptidase n=1 Tax=Lagierella sp. TaxID=2849657 RepID=UPI0026308EEB|nr:beta-aspartyl-peptidase [Lagierella sp.]
MILIKDAHIYNPEDLGRKNIIVSFGRILKIVDEVPKMDFDEVYDAKGKVVIPGIIDQHIHITGGGGEGGFETKVPELQLSKLIQAGITTAVGLLGTDSVTRSVENLVSKAIALTHEGIRTYALTGSYEYPSPTITGDVKRDIVFIDGVIGAKIASNDHRDSALDHRELARLGTCARVAGMISGKSGHVTVHLGGGKFLLDQIREALDFSNLPISTFRPTHVNRDRNTYLDSLNFALEGGYIDATCRMSSDITDVEVYKLAKEDRVLDKLTFSSDGYGSWSKYDEEGNLTAIGYSPVDTAMATLKEIVESGEPLSEALKPFTSTVAKCLKLHREVGFIKEGYISNLLVLDEDLSINSVMSMGKWMMKNGELLVKGLYE